MIEQALYEHLMAQEALGPFLATYDGEKAIFNQEAPADEDGLWGAGSQYGRVVFSVDLQGDPERIMGGILTVDVLCEDGKQLPEEIEPIIRPLIHGYFFSDGKFTAAAQWRDSAYFTEPTDHVIGCTLTFDLLGFPVLTTSDPDVIERINEWTSQIAGIHVINYDQLPATAWVPDETESVVYWRVMTDDTANWIPDTFQTIWRTATLKGHIFATSKAKAAEVGRDIATRLHAEKRLLRAGETPIMTNHRGLRSRPASYRTNDRRGDIRHHSPPR